MTNIIIAIDGPAGAGKSTISKLVATKLGINYIDTGAMYRALTLKCIENNIDTENETDVVAMSNQSDINFENNTIYLDGRDVGTHIFPNTKFKFFLNASPEERGKRRYEEMVSKGENVVLEDIIEDVKRRDSIDSKREFAPLIKADDAIEIDSTNMSIQEVVDCIVSIVNKNRQV